MKTKSTLSGGASRMCRRPDGSRVRSPHQSVIHFASLLLCALALMPLALGAATNDLSGLLQKGLFEEEANRNLEAAAQAYSTVSAQFDKDRKLAATAIFRLGEIYRKQGKTNEAAGQYERIVREFADQDTLVTLSRQNLAGMGSLVTMTGLQKTLADEQEVGRLTAQLGGIEKLKDNPEEQARAVLAFFPDETLKKMLLNLPKLKDQEVFLRANSEVGTSTSALYPKIRERGGWDTAFSPDGLEPERHGTNAVTDAQGELKKQLSWIKERVDFNVGVQKARLQVLQAAAGPMPDRESGASEKSALATDDEEKEIRRIQAMIQNSPDLINAPSATGLTPLHTAASQGQLTVARFLLDNKANVNARNNNQETPLTLAALQGHKAMVELLLSRGADVNAKGGVGYTALHQTALKGFNALAEALIANRAEIDARNQTGATPLQLAAAYGHAALAEALLNRGANANAVDNAGLTPLFHAAAAGHAALIKVLLAAKAKVDAVDKNGRTALSYAAEKGHDDSVKALLAAKADPNLGQRDLPLASAVKAGHLEIAETLLRGGAKPDLAGKTSQYVSAPGTRNSFPGDNFGPYTPLQIAVCQGDVAMVKLLLKFKADANATDAWTKPPKSLLFYTLAPKDVDLLKAFLEAKANPNVVDSDGQSPLMRTTFPQSNEMAALLVAAGADIKFAGRDGWTALHMAVAYQNKDLTALLLSKGADPNQRMKNGQTPLDLAQAQVPQGIIVPAGATLENRRALRDEIVALLRQHGALDDLPNLDRIEVRRPSANYSAIAFQVDTNGWNEFSLLELIASHYGLISTEQNAVWGVNNWEMSRFWRGPACQFPDLGHVVIRRPSSAGPQRTELAVNVAELLDSGDCARDMKLKPGDIIEIPEADHPVNEPWAGLGGPQLSNLLSCVSRTVTISIKGTPTTVRLTPEFKPTNMHGSDAKLMQALTRGSFMLKSVLAQSRLLRASSDLSRVKVTRRVSMDGKPQEWVLNCSGGNNPDLWLRDGDVIEVPDKP